MGEGWDGNKTKYMNLEGSFGFGAGGAAAGTITGAGTVPKMPVYTGATTIGDSQMSDNGVSVFIGASTSTKAIFEVNSTTLGCLFPRMTTAQRNLIAVGAAEDSLFIFNTTLKKYQFFDFTSVAWVTIESSAAGGETLAQILGNGNTTSGNDIIMSSAFGDAIVFVDGLNSISLSATPVGGAFTQVFQTASGTIALTSDISATIYNGDGTVGAGRVVTLTDSIAFNGANTTFATQNGYWQGAAKILYINPNGTTNNLFIGENSGNATMTGSENVAVGLNVLFNNTTGQYNTGVGRNSLIVNTTGQQNTSIGADALSSNTTGNFNTTLGSQALLNNTVGTNNIAIGVASGNGNTTGEFNNYFGNYSGYATTTGINNTFIGSYSGRFNVTGNNSVALGFQAGYYETASNKLFIDNTQRTNEADGREKALIYGIFAATTAAQQLNINANTNTPIAHYNYMAASNSADTIGDVRTYATYVATVSTYFIEKCTVANATKGGGTWALINSFAL